MVRRTLQFHGDVEDCDADENNLVYFNIETDKTPENSEVFELVEVKDLVENVDEPVQLPGQVCYM